VLLGKSTSVSKVIHWFSRQGGGEKRNGKDLMHYILEELELKGEKGEGGGRI